MQRIVLACVDQKLFLTLEKTGNPVGTIYSKCYSN